MSLPTQPPGTAPGERWYRALLRIYPAAFREEFGEMLVDFYRERVLGTSRAGGVSLRLRLYLDAILHGLAERVTPLRPRDDRPPSGSPRPQQGSGMLAAIHQDLRYALRSLRRSPGFNLTVLCTLALGIGANVAIFSVVNGVLLRPLPFANADRVIQLSNHDAPGTLSVPEVADVRRDARSFARVGSFAYSDGNITGEPDAERVRIARVDAGFFATLAPTFALGRRFADDEDHPGAPDVVVISYGLWQRRFGMDPGVIGRRIVLNDAPHTVIGVTPSHFDYPSQAVSIWTPLRVDGDAMTERTRHYLRLVARLAPGVTLAEADAEMRAIRDRWAAQYPESYRPSDPLQVDVRPIRDRVVGAAEPYLIALLGAVGFVLLIACVNVANLLLVRGEARRQEIVLRAALGATRRRLARLLAFESGLLTVGGGLLGVALAWPTLRLLLAAAPASIPRLETIRLDTGALAFAAGVCVLVGAFFALVPLAHIRRLSLLPELNAAARNAAETRGPAGRRTRALLVISEVALAVIMLAGAGVFLRTLSHLRHVDLGFATQDILTARISLPRGGYQGARAATFTDELVQRLRALPGMGSVAAMAWTPLVEAGGNWTFATEEAPTVTVRDAPTASPQQVTPDFFETMGIPILRGRAFTERDRAGSDPVVIVNETLARNTWRTTDVVGRRMKMSAPNWPYMTVVGVVPDTRVDGLTEPAPPIMYFPHQQAGGTAYFTASSMTLLLRAADGSEPSVPAIRQVVRELDANVPLSDVRTMAQVVASTIARHSFTTSLLSALALLAITLAAVGIYGIISYSVARRRFEFGIRVALGAGAGRILSLVLREGLGIVALGLIVGAAGAIGLGHLLESLLVGVDAVDGVTMAGVAAVLLVVASVAMAVPARRALMVEPTEAIRNE